MEVVSRPTFVETKAQEMKTSYGSLKRKRGVGEHLKSPWLGCLLRLRLLRPPIALHSNPSLALQAFSRFALLGDLEVRVPNEVAA